jgi:hypothetical protein
MSRFAIVLPCQEALANNAGNGIMFLNVPDGLWRLPVMRIARGCRLATPSNHGFRFPALLNKG